tara:strand:+ start:18209 stop:18451 length:243 start_codon:yes stop_codon:yes gene_type:complete
MKRWKGFILNLEWEGDLSATQIRQRIIEKNRTTNYIPNTRQIGHFLRITAGFEIVGEHDGTKLYRRTNDEISKNSMGGRL